MEQDDVFVNLLKTIGGQEGERLAKFPEEPQAPVIQQLQKSKSSILQKNNIDLLDLEISNQKAPELNEASKYQVMLTKDEIEELVTKRVLAIVNDSTRNLAKSLLPVLSEVVSKVRKIETDQESLALSISAQGVAFLKSMENSCQTMVAEVSSLIDKKNSFNIAENLQGIQNTKRFDEVNTKLESITSVLSPLTNTQKEIEDLKKQVEALSKQLESKLTYLGSENRMVVYEQPQGQPQNREQQQEQLQDRTVQKQQQLNDKDTKQLDRFTESKASSSNVYQQAPQQGYYQQGHEQQGPQQQNYSIQPPAPIHTHPQPQNQSQGTYASQAQLQPQAQHSQQTLQQPFTQDIQPQMPSASQPAFQQAQGINFGGFPPERMQSGATNFSIDQQTNFTAPGPLQSSSLYIQNQPASNLQPYQNNQGRASENSWQQPPPPPTPQPGQGQAPYPSNHEFSANTQNFNRPPDNQQMYGQPYSLPSQNQQQGQYQKAQFMPQTPRQQSLAFGQQAPEFFARPGPFPQPPQAGPSSQAPQNRQSNNPVTIDKIVHDISQMGFRAHDVRQEVFQMLQNGEEVDLNKVIDRLTSKGKGL